MSISVSYRVVSYLQDYTVSVKMQNGSDFRVCQSYVLAVLLLFPALFSGPSFCAHPTFESILHTAADTV